MVQCWFAFSGLTLLVGWQEGHPVLKKWGYGGGGHWLLRMEGHPAGWSVRLPLLIFPCAIKSRRSLLAPAHLGGPGKRAVKWLGWSGGAVLALCMHVVADMELHIYRVKNVCEMDRHGCLQPQICSTKWDPMENRLSRSTFWRIYTVCHEKRSQLSFVCNFVKY